MFSTAPGIGGPRRGLQKSRGGGARGKDPGPLEGPPRAPRSLVARDLFPHVPGGPLPYRRREGES